MTLQVQFKVSVLITFAIHFLDFVESGSWQVVWADEFDGPNIDYSKWTFDLGDGCDISVCKWGNSELQIYTNSTENAFIKNGRLIIQAVKQGDNKYTSARMKTLGLADWKYGKIEIKAKFPKGGSTWPNIWMLPTYSVYGIWPQSGSIDIAMIRDTTLCDTVEAIAHFGTGKYNDYHTQGVKSTLSHLKSFDKNNEKMSFADDFHIFMLEKLENSLRWFVDDKKIHQFTLKDFEDQSKRTTPYPFNERFHLLFNVAVGGKIVALTVSETSPFPQRLEIDYVRIYEWITP